MVSNIWTLLNFDEISPTTMKMHFWWQNKILTKNYQRNNFPFDKLYTLSECYLTIAVVVVVVLSCVCACMCICRGANVHTSWLGHLNVTHFCHFYSFLFSDTVCSRVHVTNTIDRSHRWHPFSTHRLKHFDGPRPDLTKQHNHDNFFFFFTKLINLTQKQRTRCRIQTNDCSSETKYAGWRLSAWSVWMKLNITFVIRRRPNGN